MSPRNGPRRPHSTRGQRAGKDTHFWFLTLLKASKPDHRGPQPSQTEQASGPGASAGAPRLRPRPAHSPEPRAEPAEGPAERGRAPTAGHGTARGRLPTGLRAEHCPARGREHAPGHPSVPPRSTHAATRTPADHGAAARLGAAGTTSPLACGARHPGAHRQVNGQRRRGLHAGEHPSAVKKNEMLPLTPACTDPAVSH